MQTFPMNGLAIVAAAIVKSIIGMIWYAPPVFGARWFRHVQCSEEELKRGMPKALVVDVIGNLVMAFVLLHAIHYAGATGVAPAVAVGFFNWLGFVVVARAGKPSCARRTALPRSQGFGMTNVPAAWRAWKRVARSRIAPES